MFATGPTLKAPARPAGLNRSLFWAAAFLSCCGLGWTASAFGYDEAVDYVMYLDPDVRGPGRVTVYQKELIPLWLKALGRPDADTRRMAAATIAEAGRRKMPGLEVTIPPLLAALKRPDQHPTVRLAAAQALVALDARESAEPLLKAAQAGGPDLRNVVEPALAHWDYAPARDVWLERLKQPALPRQAELLALRGLAEVRERKAAPRLRELVLSAATDPMIRFEAARALGVIQTKGLEKDAGRLVEEAGPTGPAARLAAASLLRYHRSEAAREVERRLALKAVGKDAEPAAADIALQALYEADPCSVVALAKRVAASRDANARGHVVEALGKCPGPEYVPLLADLTDDVHPAVRTEARKTLRELARRPAYDAPVRREATRMLATSKWRALEQAIILLTQLDHKAAAPRFIELMKFDRPEVLVTAAWGLRKLALPENLPALLEQIKWQVGRVATTRTRVRQEANDLQVAQLAQAIGQARYRPAESILRSFVPRPNPAPGNESRAAAVWALGFLHENKSPPELVEELVQRMKDLRAIAPEHPHVGWMAAVALGRMKAKDSLPTLRSYYQGVRHLSEVGNASGWAINQITGEPLPPLVPVPETPRGWFLEPIITP